MAKREIKIPIYNNYIFNRKSYIHNTPLIKEGDKVKKGQILASSNYTDNEGNIALGLNAYTAYIPYKGLTFEDAIVVSEDFAKKMASEAMYKYEEEEDVRSKIDKRRYIALFPVKYKREQLNKLDDVGVVKPGTVLKKGDPIILKITDRKPEGLNSLHRGRRSYWIDDAVEWDKDYEGIVTDVAKTPKGYQVFVKTYAPTVEGDKMTGFYGDKGIIAKVVPMDKMPRDSQGRPFDVIVNPMIIISRGNPGQIYEALLGKIAKKRGQPYLLSAFPKFNMHEFVWKELKKHGVEATDKIYDPEMDRWLDEPYLTGWRYFIKLSHTAESKASARSTGEYTTENIPAKGGEEGAKRIGQMEINALIGFGAIENIKDIKLIRGQRNDDFWRLFKAGYTPPMPKETFMYRKFIDSLKAAGIKVKEEDNYLHLFALTDKDIDKLSRGEIKVPETIDLKSNNPISGGLFDYSITGSHGGQHWAHISIPEPLPNPMFEEAIRRLLGLTEKDFNAILRGDMQYKGLYGSRAIYKALSEIDIDKEIKNQKHIAETSKGSVRSNAVRNYKFLLNIKRQGIKLTDLMWHKIPVLPPIYRPISSIDDIPLVADANLFYKDIINIRNFMEQEKQFLSKKEFNELNGYLYKAVKALVGIGDPVSPKLKEKNVKGLLKKIYGDSPKLGTFQYKMIGGTVDTSARATIGPDPSLGLDEIGIPEDTVWRLYEPFIVRRLVRKGMRVVDAVKQVSERTDIAYKALQEEVKERPVIANRAPTLHRYNFMAFWPKLVKGKILRTNPLIMKSIAGDFDGNCVSYDSKIYLKISKSMLDTQNKKFYNSLREILEKEADMINCVSLIFGKKQDIYFCMSIGKFPKIGNPIKDKNGADVYQIPDGIEILTYDFNMNKICYKPIRYFTIEHNCQLYEIRTRSTIVKVSDNESLMVFDHNTGNLKKQTPEGAKNMLVPILKKYPITGNKYDFDIGWWIGAFISDGWASGGRCIAYAKLEDEKRERFVKIARHKICENFICNEYVGIAGDNKYGNSKKVHLNGKDLHKIVDEWGLVREGNSQIRQALNKFIPFNLIDDMSEDALWGLFCGLIDGDGSIYYSEKYNRFNFTYHTSSRYLVHSIKYLCKKLGIRYTFSINKPKPKTHTKESYSFAFSVIDIWFNKKHLKFVGNRENELFKLFKSNMPDIYHTSDYIPLTKEEILYLAQYPATRSVYFRYKKDIYPKLNRHRLLKYFDEYPDLKQTLPELYKRILNQDLLWEPIEGVTKLNKETVYDFALDTGVFVVNAGIIVRDTMTFHVPVSDKAVQEARDLMLPSKNLLSIQLYKAHMMPQNEFLWGLYLASNKKNPKSNKRIFQNKEALVRALLRGEVRLDDEIEISNV